MSVLRDFLFLGGLGMLTYGIWIKDPAIAMIVLGLILAAAGAWLSPYRPWRRRNGNRNPR